MYRFQVVVEVSYLDGDEGVAQSDVSEALVYVATNLQYCGGKATLTSGTGEYVRYELDDSEDVKEID